MTTAQRKGAVLTTHARDDGVVVLSYDASGSPLNTVFEDLAIDLTRALRLIAHDPEVKGAVLTSRDPASFLDTAYAKRVSTVATMAEGEALCRRGHALAETIAGSPKPIVAAIAGAAEGPGLSVALACHGRVLADDRTTSLAFSCVKLGLVPVMGSLQRFAGLAGLAAAIEYGLSATRLTPVEAQKLGVVEASVPRSDLIGTAARLALRLAGERRSKSPVAPDRAALRSTLVLREARARIATETRGHYPAPAHLLSVLSAFVQRGFEASKEVEARAFAELGVSTVSRTLMAVSCALSELTKDAAGAGDQASSGEAAIEIIFVEGPSPAPIGEAVASAKRPDSAIGMHVVPSFCERPLLEVVRTERSSSEAVRGAVAIGKKQGKIAIVVKDGPGFYARRILVPYLFEGARLVEEGAPIDVIDTALVSWGFPSGPLALIEEIGIAHVAALGARLRDAFGDRMASPRAVSMLAESEKIGFYARGRGPFGARRGGPNNKLYSMLGVPAPEKGKKSPVAVEEIQMRCALALVNEALRCFGEGVLGSADEGDIGAIWGAGFPLFRGGPFRYVDFLGAPEADKRIAALSARLGPRWAPAPLLVEMAREKKRFYPRHG